MLTLFGHPFSSYTWKVLIPLYADGTEFEFRQVPENQDNYAELKQIWPFGRFPLLLDNDEAVIETTCIIEHLQAHHPGRNTWIPDGELGRRVRFLDRFFDLYVQGNMQPAVNQALRPEGMGDAYGAEQGRKNLHVAYDWLEANLPDGAWVAGDTFTLADCAAAPALFYADWVEEIGDGRPKLKAYRRRLLAHPQVARVVDDARPYRPYFPLGAPDRD
ncbi:glutathione S-transferase family protein [Sphingomonas segetis]|jgi:glutathione S-transferase|uniref:glutathione S-transferase family protein n=1 Tax=Sphingomonas segetis TaxID=1104779 RepID=UPI0018AD4500|nr:glutathione S-transferase family protein [Sphingomonas segetis]